MNGQARMCLKCNKRFLSKGKTNRLCSDCNKQNLKYSIIPHFRLFYEGRVIDKATGIEDIALLKEFID